jgi:outer membrane lipoprotein-sorting protein
VQIAPNGGLAGGEVYLRRPGRLRFEYDPPTPLLIVADRFWLILYDSELKEANRLPLSSTPVSVLVAKDVTLGKRTTVEKISRKPGSLRITLRDSENPDQGAITLVFGDKPLVLRSWVVTDAQGLETAIALNGVVTNVPLDPDLFVFREPAKEFHTR